MGCISHRCAPLGRAPHGCVSHRRVLHGRAPHYVYLTGVYLMGVYLMSMHHEMQPVYLVVPTYLRLLVAFLIFALSGKLALSLVAPGSRSQGLAQALMRFPLDSQLLDGLCFQSGALDRKPFFLHFKDRVEVHSRG
jgi:hypothetical protein